MSDTELEFIGERLVQIYGDSLPDPDQCPRQFEFYVKMYMYFHHTK